MIRLVRELTDRLDEAGLLGYLFSHPGRLEAPPLLHAALDLPDALPSAASAE